MEDFLRNAKQQLEKAVVHGHPEKVCVVIGNKSCDLDSAVSALTFALYKQKTAGASSVYVPVLNIPRGQYRLRTETTYLLRRQGISDDLIVFRDEIDLHDLHEKGILSLVLVDHHVVDHDVLDLEPDVVEIVDHRPQEKIPREGVRISLDIVGSCCTLVAEQLIKDESFVVDPGVATLLLGTILVDTVNTSQEAGKTTPRDLAVLSELSRMLTDVNGDELYTTIQEAKNDVSGLTSIEILEKDLKVVRGHEGQLMVAMSSVSIGIQTFLSRPGVLADMESFCKQQMCQMLVVMAIHTVEGSPRRELAIYSQSSEERQQLSKALCNSIELNLDLQSLTSGFDEIWAYHQGNVKASRKKVLPFIKSYLDDINLKLPQSSNDLLDLASLDPLGSNNSSETKGETNSTTDLLDLGLELSSDSASNQIQPQVNLDKTGSDPVGTGTNIDLLAGLDSFSSGSVIPSENSKSASHQLVGLEFAFNVDNTSGGSGAHDKTSVLQDSRASEVNLMDTLGDFTESDIMESPLRTPDIVLQGSSAASSADVSKPGSGLPSYPATPPNSYLGNSGQDLFEKEFNLPSFNSSEMVQKIWEKKELLPESSGIGEETSKNRYGKVPYTPHNSVMDDHFHVFAKDHGLPSFNSSDMLRRIEEKRSSMGDNSDMTDQKDSVNFSIFEENNVPFTPQNSLMENHFDSFAKDASLPSFNSADMVQRIQEKRSSMGKSSNSESEGLSMLSTAGDGFSPFTPANSYAESSMAQYSGKDFDQNQLSEKLSDIKTEQSLCDEKEMKSDGCDTKTDSLIDIDVAMTTDTNNVVALSIAAEMQGENSQEIQDLLNFSSGDGDDDSGGDKNSSLKNSNNQLNSSSTHSQQNSSHGLVDLGILDVTTGLDSNNDTQDIVLQEVAYSYAGEIIQQVLENYSDSQSLSAMDSGKDEGQLLLNLDSIDSVKGQAEDVATGEPHDNVEHQTGELQGQPCHITVETDYLPNMDPLHGSFDLVSGGHADPEVVESTSFRRISGEEPNTVNGDVLVDFSSPENPGNPDASSGVTDSPTPDNTEANLDPTLTSKSEEISAKFAQNLAGEVILNTVSNVSIATDDAGKIVNKKMESDSNGTSDKEAKDSDVSQQLESSAKEGNSVLGRHFSKSSSGSISSEDMSSSNQLESLGELDFQEIETENLLRKDQRRNSNNNGEAGVNSNFNNSFSGPIPDEENSAVVFDLDNDLVVSTEGRDIELVKSNGTPGYSEVLAETPGGEIANNGDTVSELSPLSDSSPTSEISSTTTEGSYRITDSTNMSPCGPGQTTADITARAGEITPTDSGDKEKKLVEVRGIVTSISSESMTSDSGARSDLLWTDVELKAGGNNFNSDVAQTVQSEDKKIVDLQKELLAKEGDESAEMRQNGSPDQRERREIFMTTAGRISITTDENMSSQSMSIPDTPLTSISSDPFDTADVPGETVILRSDSLIAQADELLLRTADTAVSTEVFAQVPDDVHPSMTEERGNNSSKFVVCNSGFRVPDDDEKVNTSRKNTTKGNNSVANSNADDVKKGHNSNINPDQSSTNVMNRQDNVTKDKLRGIEFTEEWQEDDIPGMPPAEEESDTDESSGSRSRHSSASSTSSTERRAARPSSLGAHTKPKRKIAANFNILSDDLEDDLIDPTGELEWENDTPVKMPVEPLPEFTAEDEYKESKMWRGVEIGGKSFKIDLKVIDPYKKVLSHGGYYGDGLNAIIIFSGCYLPDRSRRDYQYVMDNLFMYVINTLETLVAEDYMIVYFHGATPRRQMPSFSWLRRCYQMIDRRLRKNLKSLMLVHPTLWLKTIVMMTKPFISSKFTSKLRFVRSLKDLSQIVPMEYIYVPDQVQQYDEKVTRPNSTASTVAQQQAPDSFLTSS